MSNDYTNPNTNPNILMAGTLTLNDRQDAFESLCVPVFCDYTRNYSGTFGGPQVTSFIFALLALGVHLSGLY